MGLIYLIRHGEVQWNKENTFVGSTDLPLDSTGLHQAARLAEYLEDKALSAIYSSDLIRAMQTAKAIAERVRLSVTPIPELREFDYGEWEGVAEAKVISRYPDLYKQWRADSVGVKVPGGESFGELRDRAFPEFCRIAEAHQQETAAIVGHKSVNRMILCCLLRIDVNLYKRIGQVNAAVNIIRRGDDGTFIVEAVTESGHLCEA